MYSVDLLFKVTHMLKKSMQVTYLYTDLQDKLVQMMVEYLCEDHTETELMELVQKAIKYSDGDKD